MVSNESIFFIGSLVIFCISFFYYGFSIREQNKFKAAQLRLEQIRFINDSMVDKAFTEILWVWKWTDFDDYWSKYSPRANPEANINRRVARNYYVALASMVRSGDLDIGLLYELNPSGVTRYWEKLGPIALEFRKRNNYPDYLEPVEYLAKKMAEYRDNRGISAPKKVS
jgi:hypothetical protein